MTNAHHTTSSSNKDRRMKTDLIDSREADFEIAPINFANYLKPGTTNTMRWVVSLDGCFGTMNEIVANANNGIELNDSYFGPFYTEHEAIEWAYKYIRSE